jgi:hypothetical protein
MNFERSSGGILLPKNEILLGGVLHIEHRRLFRDEYETIDEWDEHNLVVNQGLNHLLNTEFDAGTPVSSWFIGLFQGNYTPVATDTAANIAANSTECSSYTSATRPAWTPAAATAQSISNSGSPATFTFNASVTVYGGFLISNSTIAGTAGVLFSASQFGAAKPVVNTDQLIITYTFNASSV